MTEQATRAHGLPHGRDRAGWGGPFVDTVRRYGIAIIAVGAVLGLKSILGALGADHPFVLLPAAVIVAAWYGGRGPGLVAVLLAVAATAYAFVPDPGQSTDPGDLVGLVGLVAEGVLIVAVTVGLRSARLRAEAAASASEVARRETAFALAIRDEMLNLWTQKLRGPMADLESDARAALAALERDGHHGEADDRLRRLIEDAARVSRITVSWEAPREPAESSETAKLTS